MGIAVKAAPALLVLVSACTTTELDANPVSSLARQAAGPATLASFAELCGTPVEKVDRYVEAYLAYARSRMPIAANEEKTIRKMFDDGRSEIYFRFPTPESVTRQCTRHPPNEAVLDRGIAGDFSGQV